MHFLFGNIRDDFFLLSAAVKQTRTRQGTTHWERRREEKPSRKSFECQRKDEKIYSILFVVSVESLKIHSLIVVHSKTSDKSKWFNASSQLTLQMRLKQAQRNPSVCGASRKRQMAFSWIVRLWLCECFGICKISLDERKWFPSSNVMHGKWIFSPFRFSFFIWNFSFALLCIQSYSFWNRVHRMFGLREQFCHFPFVFVSWSSLLSFSECLCVAADDISVEK